MTKARQHKLNLKDKHEDARTPSFFVLSSHQINVLSPVGISKNKRRKKCQVNDQEQPTSSPAVEQVNLLLSNPVPPPESLPPANDQAEQAELPSTSASVSRSHLENEAQKHAEPPSPSTPPPIRNRLRNLSHHNLLSNTNERTPDVKSKTKKFTQALEAEDTPTRNEMFSAVKHSHRKKQKPMLISSKNPSPDDGVDPFAFRSKQDGSLRKGVLFLGDSENESIRDEPLYKVEKSVYKAERRAVQKNKDAILSAGDDDQITLALKLVLEDPKIRPYYARIVGEKNPEAVKVGVQAVAGMRKLVDIVAANRDNGGRGKKCRALCNQLL